MEGTGKNVKKHYAHIKNLSRLLSKQNSNHNGAVFHCKICLNPFTSQEILDRHTPICKSFDKNGCSMPEMPKTRIIKHPITGAEEEEEPTLKFTQHTEIIPHPFSIEVDIESDLIDNEVNEVDGITRKEHIMYSYAYKVNCFIDNTKSKPVKLVVGNARQMLDDLKKETAEIMKIYTDSLKTKPRLNVVETREFNKATKCYLCKLTCTTKVRYWKIPRCCM
eukprot:Lithocolla_globosa_v1_NODE_2335_length_2044_cov_8.581699.p2 type:complete len:221 gc:universal NODE_2335_length_2044_cov_8.581699:1318-656(-)